MGNGSADALSLPPLKLYEVADIPYSMRLENSMAKKAQHEGSPGEATIIIDNGKLKMC